MQIPPNITEALIGAAGAALVAWITTSRTGLANRISSAARERIPHPKVKRSPIPILALGVALTALVISFRSDSRSMDSRSHIDDRVDALEAEFTSNESRLAEEPSPSGDPQLHLLSLRCITTEDAGTDEAYLEIGDSRIWRHNISEGDSESLEHLVFPLTDPIGVELWDRDNGRGDWLDSDDHLGTISITGEMRGQGEMSREFGRDGARYVLTFEVR